jgi:hypothetical protein
MAIMKKNKPNQTQSKPNKKASSACGTERRPAEEAQANVFGTLRISIYTGAPNCQSVTLFLRFSEKFHKTTIIWPKTHKKISPAVFNLLFGGDYLSFHPVAPARRQGSEKILFQDKKLWTRLR